MNRSKRPQDEAENSNHHPIQNHQVSNGPTIERLVFSGGLSRVWEVFFKQRKDEWLGIFLLGEHRQHHSGLLSGVSARDSSIIRAFSAIPAHASRVCCVHAGAFDTHGEIGTEMLCAVSARFRSPVGKETVGIRTICGELASTSSTFSFSQKESFVKHLGSRESRSRMILHSWALRYRPGFR